MFKKILYLLTIFNLIFSPLALSQTLYDFDVNRYSGWSGLNDRGLDIGIKPTELSYIRNANYDNPPYLTKREGYQKHTAYQIASDRTRGLFPFYRANGTKFLLAVINQTIYDVTNGYWTELKSGLTSLDVEYDGVTFEDKFFITSNSDPLMEFDGTSISDVGGSPPQGAYIEAHANRLFIAGNYTYPSRVYYSDLLDETSWDTTSEFGNNAGYFDVAPNDGDKIKAWRFF
jgi:hypothetical protein